MMAFCVHRYSVVKRWQQGNSWYAIQRCRKCDDWKRVEITMDKGKPIKTTVRISESGLENSSIESVKTQDIDTESGSIGPKDAS